MIPLTLMLGALYLSRHIARQSRHIARQSSRRPSRRPKTRWTKRLTVAVFVAVVFAPTLAGLFVRSLGYSLTFAVSHPGTCALLTAVVDAAAIAALVTSISRTHGFRLAWYPSEASS